ncbi:sensor domain-containing diguanylate cyclase [Bacillus suaedaesalsae]|uniref:Sensor domain-containing diguanylate cyclase n=1 Tax=Bacillus suaedaesalsae TaxID=2810349 RepID=A0ABS2DEJ7_9BACI|nr:sensor domain-containing diguanylate cyclase [Bacillus suaedaesalsae]MBM6616884.1 sensor domain-containing diguanylate cyclase [Bacillus suaedaesalsae]
MNSSYIQLFIAIIILGLLTNYFRFKVKLITHKLILTISSLLLVIIDGILFQFLHSEWLLLVLIGIASISFSLYIILPISFLAWWLVDGDNMYVLFGYLLFGAIIFFIKAYIANEKAQNELWLSKALTNSKQLNVFKEVSFSMQQSFQFEKLLQTILTSVTAGHGLGFNRALILLKDEDGRKLRGIMGTGPMSAEEGYAIWEDITKNRYKLSDLIERKEIEKTADMELNQIVKKLEIKLDEPSFLTRTLESGNPLHISKKDVNDDMLQLFRHLFNMEEMAVFPLISQMEKVGLLIIDNPVNKKPITATDIESVVPIANQAAIAIQHSRLYTKIEDMALKDGLTGLYNQRAFQSFLDQLFPKDKEQDLSLIILDIDFFKHFNDTNGHLLGNEVLVELARVITQSIRNNDVAFRFGGEEFVVLLPNTTKVEAVEIAESLRRNVEKAKFPSEEHQPGGCLTVSLGVASSEGIVGSTSYDLFDLADKALYEAKDTGKNRVVS